MSRHDAPGPRAGNTREPLIAGHRWYRERIRFIGPFLGVVPAILLGAAAYIALELGDGNLSGLIGLVGGVSAAPGLLLAGAPFADESNYPLAVLASVPLWLLLGFLASRRATKPLLASWRDYWRELFWLTIAVVIGSIVALLAATAVLGESLI